VWLGIGGQDDPFDDPFLTDNTATALNDGYNAGDVAPTSFTEIARLIREKYLNETE
jgi:hypothetical protein